MDEFLLKINECFNNKDFTNWYLDDLFFDLNKYNTPTSEILKKYYYKRNNSFKLSNDEANLIKNNYDIRFNILIKSFLDYLLTCSKYYNTSNLEEDTIELIDLYFNNIKLINDGLPIYNLSTILKWTISKIPKSKSNIRTALFEKLINGDINVLRYISFIDYFIRDN